MIQERFADVVDAVTMATIRQLCEADGPYVSIYLPTHPDLPDLTHDALVLRGLLERAEAALADGGVPAQDASAVVGPLWALVEDREFWRYQAEGLALFAWPGGHLVLRLPISPAAYVQVGEVAHLTPLVAVASGDAEYIIAAVSLNQVRLFASTRDAIHELPLGPVPASLEDIERQHQSESELQHQHQPPAGGIATFHGHGGTEYSSTAVDKFFLELSTGLRERLGADTRLPILLAAVAEHLPRLRERNQLPTLLDEVLGGNPDQLPAAELRERSWPLMAQVLESRHREVLERLGALLGQGKATTDPEAILAAAREGRINTLIVSTSTDAAHSPTLDEALKAAVMTSAELVSCPLDDQVALAALLRY